MFRTDDRAKYFVNQFSVIIQQRISNKFPIYLFEAGKYIIIQDKKAAEAAALGSGCYE